MRRRGPGYASDVSDEAWALIKGLLPLPRELGRPRETDLREVVNALFYIAWTGCPWRALPKDFPPFTTVQGYVYAWRDEGVWEAIGHVLAMAAREAAGREASPSAGVIDSQSVKTTEAGGPWGYDAGKKIKGRKRHILTDTEGTLIAALVHPADIQDRDGAPGVLGQARYRWPWLRHVFADGGYAGDKLRLALAGKGDWTLDIVRRTGDASGFVVLPRRWVALRTFAQAPDDPDDSPRTGKPLSPPQPPGSSSPTHASSSVGSLGYATHDGLPSQALIRCSVPACSGLDRV